MDLSGFCRFCLSDEEAQISINEDSDIIEKINSCLPNKVCT